MHVMQSLLPKDLTSVFRTYFSLMLDFITFTMITLKHLRMAWRNFIIGDFLDRFS